MTRMFKSITSTWNPVKGCRHDCSYCCAEVMANRFRTVSAIYRDVFEPKFIPWRMGQKFRAGDFIFVCFMGDLFGKWVPEEWIRRIIEHITKYPETDFLFLTKNPGRYRLFKFPPNAVLGTTIETNRNYLLTNAPEPRERYMEMLASQHPRQFISIEPVMDFDDNTLIHWIQSIKPELVEIGVDNYHNNLLEPPWEKISRLLIELRAAGIPVNEKKSLERLHA